MVGEGYASAIWLGQLKINRWIYPRNNITPWFIYIHDCDYRLIVIQALVWVFSRSNKITPWYFCRLTSSSCRAWSFDILGHGPVSPPPPHPTKITLHWSKMFHVLSWCQHNFELHLWHSQINGQVTCPLIWNCCGIGLTSISHFTKISSRQILQFTSPVHFTLEKVK